MNKILLEVFVAFIVTLIFMFIRMIYRIIKEDSSREQARRETERKTQDQKRKQQEEIAKYKKKIEERACLAQEWKESPELQYFRPFSDDFRVTAGYDQMPTETYCINDEPEPLFEYTAFVDMKKSGYFGEDARYISNAIVPTNTGTFTEIDLLIISRYGLYIIECKNYGYDMRLQNVNDAEAEYPVGSGKKIKNPLHQQAYHAAKMFEYLEANRVRLASEVSPGVMDGFERLHCYVVLSNEDSCEIARGLEKQHTKYFDNYINTSTYFETNKNDLTPVWTKQEVNKLYTSLAPLYQYTPKQRDQMIDRRLAEAGSFSTPKKYYVVSENGYDEVFQVARYDGFSYDVCVDLGSEYFTYEKMTAYTGGKNIKCPSMRYISGPYNSFVQAKRNCVAMLRKQRSQEGLLNTPGNIAQENSRESYQIPVNMLHLNGRPEGMIQTQDAPAGNMQIQPNEEIQTQDVPAGNMQIQPNEEIQTQDAPAGNMQIQPNDYRMLQKP